MEVIEVRAATPSQWAIALPLWTSEEGRSDLTIELTLIADGESFRIELDNIHVP